MSDLTPWNAGYQTGHRRGIQDGVLETVQRYLRDPDHKGFPDEPPLLDSDERAQWVDGFLQGYADGRRDTLRGEAA